jgi:hypothetical protein
MPLLLVDLILGIVEIRLRYFQALIFGLLIFYCEVFEEIYKSVLN